MRGQFEGEAAGSLAARLVFEQFFLPPFSMPQVLSAGSDGRLWFSLALRELEGGKEVPSIGAIAASGTKRIYQREEGKGSFHPVAGPGGMIWFIDPKHRSIGRIDVEGNYAEPDLPLGGTFEPAGLSLSSLGELWVTSNAKSQACIIAPDLSRRWIDCRASSGMVAGDSGLMWATNGARIFSMNSSGEVDFDLYVDDSASVRSPIAYPGGDIGFIDDGRKMVCRLSADGSISSVSIDTVGDLFAITPARRGGTWGTVNGSGGGGGRLFHLSGAGQVSWFDPPQPDNSMTDLSIGSDGNLWIVDSSKARILKAFLPPV